jgi:Na+/H+-dicarboxylate symporter
MTGVDLSTAQIVGVIGTLVVSAIGAPGTPGVSVAIFTTIAAGLGIPSEGMVLTLGLTVFWT